MRLVIFICYFLNIYLFTLPLTKLLFKIKIKIKTVKNLLQKRVSQKVYFELKKKLIKYLLKLKFTKLLKKERSKRLIK